MTHQGADPGPGSRPYIPQGVSLPAPPTTSGAPVFPVLGIPPHLEKMLQPATQEERDDLNRARKRIGMKPLTARQMAEPVLRSSGSYALAKNYYDSVGLMLNELMARKLRWPWRILVAGLSASGLLFLDLAHQWQVPLAYVMGGLVVLLLGMHGAERSDAAPDFDLVSSFDPADSFQDSAFVALRRKIDGMIMKTCGIPRGLIEPGPSSYGLEPTMNVVFPSAPGGRP